MDLVFFAGPVIVSDAFKRIDWHGRDVRIVPIVGSGSTTFSNLAESLRDSSGRILPNLLQRYARGITPDKVALAAYSAGHGLLNKIGQVASDRDAVTAMLLSDATFSGFSEGPKRGYVAFGIEAAQGAKLMVSTTANTTDGSYLSGRDSFALVFAAVAAATHKTPRQHSAKAPLPTPRAGCFSIGSLTWANYSPTVGPGTELGHGALHDLTPELWQAYLAPWLVGPPAWLWGAVGATVLGGAAWLATRSAGAHASSSSSG